MLFFIQKFMNSIAFSFDMFIIFKIECLDYIKGAFFILSVESILYS
jgi:hypothetical protein